MMTRKMIAFVFVGALVLTYGSMACGQEPAVPQGTVVCTGWHALCSLATDCKVVSDTQANCNCWKVKEQYIVVTADISDTAVREATLTVCTTARPCDVDESPVCKAIQDGSYTVGGVTYEWVSTFSYRGWCKNWDPVACDEGPWADCMTSPCTENPNPKDPDRPLICQCTIKTKPFIGSKGRCRTRKGTVMSTINQDLWDFHTGMFTLPMPGDAYVVGACAPLASDGELEE